MARYITDSTPCPHSAVFRLMVARWQAHPFLKRWIKTWCVWSGCPGDLAEADVTAGAWARLTPITEGFELDSESTTEAPLGVRIELVIPGTCVDDLMDLWSAFGSALYPGDGSFLEAMETAGGYGYRIKSGPYSEVALADGTVNLAGVGLFVCFVKINTPI